MEIHYVLLITGIILLLLSLAGYVYVSNMNKKNTSQLKKDQKAALKKKSKSTKVTSHSLLAVAGLLIIISLIMNVSGKYNIENLNYGAQINVTNDKNYGAGHSEEPIQYEMKIPTSGIHNPHDLKFGFYEEKPPYEKLVHNLEHGDIVIYFHPDASADLKAQLEVLSHYKRAGSGVLVVPNADVPAGDEVIATAWTKTLELPSYDEEKIGTFIYQYMNHGPEVIPPEIRKNGGTM